MAIKTEYPETGWYWHIHHDALFGWCSGYAERASHIQATKPSSEIPTRLRLFAPMQNPPSALVKARAEWDKARTELGKARMELDKARAEWGKARTEWVKARTEFDKARTELDKARTEFDKDEIKALHALECPGCPWNGKTIIFSPIGDING